MEFNIDNCNDTKASDDKDSAENKTEIKRELESNDFILLDNLSKNDHIEKIRLNDYVENNSYEDFKVKNEEIDLKFESSDYGDNTNTEESTHECEKVDTGKEISNDDCYINKANEKEEQGAIYPEVNDLETVKKSNYFECKVDRMTNQKKQLDDHIAKKKCSMQSRLKHNVDNDSKIFKCNYCPYETRRKRNLTRHIKGHENIEDLKCTLYTKAFAKKNLFDSNISRYVRKKLYNCDQCGYECLKKTDLLRHNVIHGITDENILKCYQCTYHTYRKKALLRHIKIHQNIKDFICTFCLKVFAQKFTLDNHLLTIHKCRNRKNIYSCDQCSYESLNKSALLSHKIKHGMTDGFPMLKCYQCTFTTYHKYNLIGHIKTHQYIKHNMTDGIPILKCHQSISETYRKSSVIGHVKTHQNIKHSVTDGIPVLICYQCTFETYRKSALARHVKTHQNIKHITTDGTPIFKCYRCTYQTYRKGDLISHVKVHQNIKNPKDFKCTLCSKAFTRKFDLDGHLLRIHKCGNRKKIYNCDQCSYDCIKKSHLLRHKVKHGTTDGIPIFKCYQCTYQTYRKDSLIKHVKIHQSIKEFKCSYCSKEFIQKRGLVKHLSRIHKDRDTTKKLHNCNEGS